MLADPDRAGRPAHASTGGAGPARRRGGGGRGRALQARRACCRRRSCCHRPVIAAPIIVGLTAVREYRRLDGVDAAAGERGAGAAGRCRGCAHRLVPAGRWRPGAVRHPGRRARGAGGAPVPAAFRMLHRRPPGLAALRLRRPAARRHPPDGRTRAAASCSTWPRRAAASASPTSCAPTCCRTAGSTRSTPTIIWASAATSAISGPRPPCCASSGSSGCGC